MRVCHPDTPPRMHKRLLYLLPHSYEQSFFATYYRPIDIFTCTVIPIFLVTYLVTYPNQRVASVWYCTLMARGYRLTLLLLQSLRQKRVYERLRYRIVLIERLLQQFVSAVLVTSGPQADKFVQTMVQTNPVKLHVRNLVVCGGGVSVCLMTFWLPLDITSQVVLNTIWFCIYCPVALSSIAYSMAALVRNMPWLVWAQWGLECMAKGVLFVFTLALGGSSSNSSSLATLPAGDVLQVDLASEQQPLSEACSSSVTHRLLRSAADAVAVPAGPAPDVASVAGRRNLVLAAVYMSFVMWFLPLLLAWCLERHLKSKMIAKAYELWQQPPTPERAGGTDFEPPNLVVCRKDAAALNQPSNSQGGFVGVDQDYEMFHTFPEVLPLWLPPSQLLKVLGVAFGTCFITAELFVCLCAYFPAVAGMLRKQSPAFPQHA